MITNVKELVAVFVKDKRLNQLSASTSPTAFATQGTKSAGGSGTLVSYRYLEQRSIVTNRMCLARAIANYGFPQPLELGTNRLAWRLEEVEAWLASRPRRTPKTGAKEASQNLEAAVE